MPFKSAQKYSVFNLIMEVKVMSEFAVRKELDRVRLGKRALEAEVQLLRADMEQGKIHLRVKGEEDFRSEVARCVVQQAHPGYHGMAYNYADPVEGRVYYKERNAAWNPWVDSINWRIVAVDELINQEGNDFSPEVDWKCADIPYRDMAIAYLESEDEELEKNGGIPEWVRLSDVIAFARNGWSEIQAEEALCLEQAIDFALSEFKDEIVVDINS